MSVIIKVTVKPNSRSVPVERFVGVPQPGLPGQFLAFNNTWQYPDAAVSTITKKAQGAISGHRVVYSFSQTHAAYADQSEYTQVRKIIGITTGAAADGDDLVIQDKGILIEPGWAWAAGDIYLGANGQLTQVRPATGCLVLIGAALAPTAMQINIDFIVNLS